MTDHLQYGESQIRLETRDGIFISYARITQMYIPPQVVMWGTRIFAVQRGHIVNDCQLYREATSAIVLDPTPYAEPLQSYADGR